ncbi:MFS transporter [Ovoidimarina sediminis]|uniref:MFS transporter n=1 Tax=Ovoidimarina sediminis TaxID=3079856 RepID=UPI00290B1584|nr:MFS transporter [Rhodophyticola sp. MJ-SS7]MDU8945369.1 MFS transporter [Rhodophyticola sp. MJ-SS7]
MRTDWRLILLLFVAGLFAAAQFAKIALTLDDLALIYPDRPVAFAVSAQSVMGVLFGVTAGVIVARLGARRVLLAALLAGAGFSAVQAMLPPFPLFMALRLAEGAAHLALVVAAPTLMAAVAAPRDISVAMGLWGTFFGVGFAAAAAAVPFLGGPTAVYLVHGAGLLVLAAVLWPILPKVMPPSQPGEGLLARHLAIYRNPRVFAGAAGFLWHAATFLGLLTFLPRFLGGWTGPVLPLAALVGTFGAGVLARRISPARITAFGYGASILGLGLLLMVPETLRAPLALLVFVFIGLIPGGAFATIPWLNPDPADRARGNGALAQMGNVGTFLSVPLFSVTLGAGLAGPVALAAAISAAGLGALWLIHRKIAKSA